MICNGASICKSKFIFTPTYEGHLEDKIIIRSIGVWWYLSHKIYEKNNWYVWQAEISAATKPTVLSQNLCCKQRSVIDASFTLRGDF